MKNPFYTLLAVMAISFHAIAGGSQGGKMSFTHGDPFLSGVFLRNRDIIPDYNGQKIQFYANHENLKSFFTSTSVMYYITDVDKAKKAAMKAEEKEEGEEETAENERERMTVPIHTTLVTMRWIGANPNAQITEENNPGPRYTYIKPSGNTFTSVETEGYQKITYKEIYPGIDIVYTFPEKGGLEYSVIVRPGADPGIVRMEYSGSITGINKNSSGNIIISTVSGDLSESMPVAYTADGKTLACESRIENNIVSFKMPNGYDASRALTIDPYIVALTSMPPTNMGFNTDYDFNGNLLVYGAGPVDDHDPSALFNIAKYSTAGSLLWVFLGQVPIISWATYYSTASSDACGGMIVEKTTGKIFMSKGYDPSLGTSAIRLSTSGLYDNFVSSPTTNYNEMWSMAYNCATGDVLGVGGGTSSNLNLGIMNQTTGNVTTTNITGITGGLQDIVCTTYDTAGNMYALLNGNNGLLPFPNILYKINAALNGYIFATTTGHSCFHEAQNKQFWMSGLFASSGANDFNAIAANGSYLYYYDGFNVAAFKLSTGAPVGTANSIPGYDSLFQGGIAVDNCNNVYVGGVGQINTFTFNGSVFTPGTPIPLGGTYSSAHVYDVRYNSANNLLYATGNGFVGTYTATLSASCSNSALYSVSVSQTCDSATVHVTPGLNLSPRVFSYIWLDAAGSIVSTLIASSDTINTIPISSDSFYTVHVQWNENCGGSTVTDTVYGSAVVRIAHQDTTICSGTSVSLYAGSNIPGGTYSWQPGGAATDSVVVSPAVSGSYIVSYTTPTCGIVRDTARVSVVATPTVSVNSQNICLGDSVTITATTLVGGGTFLWQPGGHTTSSIRVAPAVASSYTVTYTAPHCGTATDTAHITPVAKPSLSAVGDTVCFGDSIHLSASASIGGGTYMWLPDSVSGSHVAINNAGNTLYYVTYSLNGCVVTDSAEGATIPRVSAGPDQNSYIGSNIYMNATAVTGASWSAFSTNPAVVTFGSNTSATTSTYGYTVAGTYGFVWTVNGCTDTMYVTITSPTYPGPNDTICMDGTVTMDAAYQSGDWYFVSGPITPFITDYYLYNTTVTGFTAAGNYYFEWYNYYNYTYDTMTVTVVAHPNAGPDQTIPVSTIATMAAAGTPGQWSAMAGNPATTVFANMASPNTSISGFTVPGTYNFIWTLAGGCSDTMQITVTGSNAGPDQTICQDNAAVMAASGTGTWSQLPSDPVVTAISNTTSPVSAVTGFTVAGVYYYIWTTAFGDDTMSITVNARPSAGPDQTICINSTVTMAATGTTGTWTAMTGNPATTTIASPGSPATSITGFTAAGVYSFAWTVNSCPDTVIINVDAAPSVTANSTTICPGQIAALSATVSQTGGAYLWTPGGATSSAITVSPATTTGYSVSYTYTPLGCAAVIALDTVFVTSAPVVSVNDTTICTGSSTSLTATPNVAGGTYIWSPGGATTQSITVSPVTYTTYSVTYTVVGCGTATDTGAVTVDPLPTLSVNNDTICQGQSATLTVTPSRTGGSYTWTPGGSNIQSIIVSPAANATYYISYQMAGCAAVTDSGIVAVDIPAALTQGNAAICQGQIAVLSVVPSIAGGSFLWTPGGETTASVTVSPASTTAYVGSYTLPQSVCAAALSYDTVFVTPLPGVSVPNATVCAGLSVTLSATPTQAGGTYLWSPGGATAPDITVSPGTTTTYTVAYTLLSCPAVFDSAIVVTVTTPPTVTVGVQNADCIRSDGALWAIVVGDASPYSYLWSDASHTAADTLSGLFGNSTYTVTVSDQSHCTATASGLVGTTTVPLTIADTFSDITCFGLQNGYISVHVPNCSNCTFEWSNRSTDSTLTGLAAGSYSVTASSPGGCTDSVSFTIHQPAQATLTISPGDTTVAEGLGFSFDPLFGPYPASDIVSYYWSPAAGLSCSDCAQPAFNMSAGTYQYTLVISYNQGCRIADTVNVVVFSQHLIYVPNSFTPNGDGINDIFQVFPIGAHSIHLRIFDRWGEKVFETDDSGVGWDGIYRGSRESTGVFVYELDVTFDDGYAVHNKGSLTLIK